MYLNCCVPFSLLLLFLQKYYFFYIFVYVSLFTQRDINSNNMRRLTQRASTSLMCRVRHVIGKVERHATIAAAVGVGLRDMAKIKPIEEGWARINVLARQRLTKFAATMNDTDLIALSNEYREGKIPHVPITISTKDLMTHATSVINLVNIIENALTPIRKYEKQRDALQQECDLLQDTINLGLARSNQEAVSAATARISEARKELTDNRRHLREYTFAHFDTHFMNDTLTILWLAGKKYDVCNVYAVRLMQEFATAGVPFDMASRVLQKMLIFGDTPQEDSDLLFTYVENPERGEVSVAKPTGENEDDLSLIADAAMVTLSRRHVTPLTEGVKLRMTETHPMLQRSLE